MYQGNCSLLTDDSNITEKIMMDQKQAHILTNYCLPPFGKTKSVKKMTLEIQICFSCK